MVCTLGRERMASMARLLDNGNYRKMTAEEAGHEKLAAQSIHRELREADEANLLEEEDMHVFDRKPMVDPLHLVCCNNCKKPVKASQYAAHADRCRSLTSMDGIFLEVDGGTGHKKPPRKGRKKLQTAHETATVGEQRGSAFIDGDNTAASESVVDDQTWLTSFSKEAKRNSTSIGGASEKDGLVVCPKSTNYPEVVTSPSEKRTKLIAAEHLLMSEGLETARGVTTKIGFYQEASTYPPVPLATKMYHSQRNLRLRFALNHLYQEASTKTHPSNPLSPNLLRDNVTLSSQVSSPKNSLHESESNDFLQKKKDSCSSSSVRTPDQILAQSSELCFGNSGGYSSAMDFSNQFRDNFSRPALSVDTATMGIMRSKYLSTAYSYPGNSGTSLGNMQQPNGSVPVV